MNLPRREDLGADPRQFAPALLQRQPVVPRNGCAGLCATKDSSWKSISDACSASAAG